MSWLCGARAHLLPLCAGGLPGWGNGLCRALWSWRLFPISCSSRQAWAREKSSRSGTSLLLGEGGKPGRQEKKQRCRCSDSPGLLLCMLVGCAF